MGAKVRKFEVVCFDLDGTLLRGTTVSLFTAGRLGKEGELLELERRYAAGEISNATIAEASARWFAGVPLAEVAGWLQEAPWIEGIAETVHALKERGLRVVLATVTWRFAAEVLRDEHGFDAACGTEMDVVGGRLTGRVSRHFDEHDKLRFVEGYCRRRKVPMSRCVAVGDSRSDVPLFRKAGLAIAVNATPDVRIAADLDVDTEDISSVLRAVFPRVPGGRIVPNA
jgi:phosphoserine phosphatase